MTHDEFKAALYRDALVAVFVIVALALAVERLA